MLDWVFLIIKSFFLVPMMLLAALFNGVLCKIGVDLACQELDYNLEVLRSSALVAGATIGVLVVGIPVLIFLILNGPAIFGGLGRLVIGLLKAVIAVPLFILRALVAIPLFILRALARVPAWLHYFFVPHPAARVLNQAHGAVAPRPIDERELANVLHDEAKPPFWFWLVPSFVARNMEKKAKAHEERLRAEMDMMEAAIERERARGSYERHGGRRT